MLLYCPIGQAEAIADLFDFLGYFLEVLVANAAGPGTVRNVAMGLAMLLESDPEDSKGRLSRFRANAGVDLLLLN